MRSLALRSRAISAEPQRYEDLIGLVEKRFTVVVSVYADAHSPSRPPRQSSSITQGSSCTNGRN